MQGNVHSRAGRDELLGLTGLRGLMAGAVFALHCGYFPYGFLGVDVFFLLSGTVLAHVYRAGCRAGEFWCSRAARILPCYLAAVFITIAARAITLGPSSASDVIDSVLIFPLLWHRSGINDGLWSIAIESYLYLAFPFILGVLMGLSGAVRVAVLAICALGSAMLIVTGALGGGWAHGPPALARGLMPFIAGVLLLPHTVRALRASRLVVPLLETRPIRWLGEISLPFYLLQNAVFLLGLTDAAAFAANLALAGAVHYAIEAPARRWLRRLRRPTATRRSAVTAG